MKKIIIYTDGASRGNPGPGSVGVVFCNEKGEIIKTYSSYLGERVTNNEAEYQAVIHALKKFIALFGKQLAKKSEVEIKVDSELLVKQLGGEYKISNPRIQELFIQLWNLKTEFGKINFKQVPREKNKEADRLANEALDEQVKTTLL